MDKIPEWKSFLDAIHFWFYHKTFHELFDVDFRKLRKCNENEIDAYLNPLYPGERIQQVENLRCLESFPANYGETNIDSRIMCYIYTHYWM